MPHRKQKYNYITGNCSGLYESQVISIWDLLLNELCWMTCYKLQVGTVIPYRHHILWINNFQIEWALIFHGPFFKRHLCLIFVVSHWSFLTLMFVKQSWRNLVTDIRMKQRYRKFSGQTILKGVCMDMLLLYVFWMIWIKMTLISKFL